MNKFYLQWGDVFKALEEIDLKENIIYGVPNGGMIASSFLKYARVTHIPGTANIILDDIEDTGSTRNFYKREYPQIRFHPLFVRSKMSKIDGELPWIVFPWELEHPSGEKSVHENIVRILEYLGEDVSREGLKDTPDRVVKSWGQIYGGYFKSPKDILTTFDANGYDQIVLLKDIEFYSTCEHHMLPFYGKAHVAYLPDKKVIGISKLARLVDIYARRLSIQEKITDQVTDALMEHLMCRGAACIIEARHTCMCMRGVKKQHSVMVTSSMKGTFLDTPSAKEELMQLIRG